MNEISVGNVEMNEISVGNVEMNEISVGNVEMNEISVGNVEMNEISVLLSQCAIIFVRTSKRGIYSWLFSNKCRL